MRYKILFIYSIFQLYFLSYLVAQDYNVNKRPKLVVGIVVDQMRYDYLYRFQNKYSDKGFKLLLKDGYNCKYVHYNYIPTFTAPGHAAIYTGSVPAVNGIVANQWYDKTHNKYIYCVSDSTQKSIGSESDAGMMSPRNMYSTTITDQLRLATNFKSKVIGISLKDRGSILPAGHTANAAYWFDSSNGSWISSSYYMKELPNWVKNFNNNGLAKKYANSIWNTLLPIEEYTESQADNQIYERNIDTETEPVFPHKISSFDNLKVSPFGNSLTTQFALETILSENLGKGESTDFLTLSFSSTDYVGHSFGPYSIELQDTYLRLDRDIAEILAFLDKHIGTENVLVYLTADHAVANIAEFNKINKIPAGIINDQIATKSLNDYINAQLGEDKWIDKLFNSQIYVNFETLENKKVSYDKLYDIIRKYYLTVNYVSDVVDLHNIAKSTVPSFYIEKIKNGIDPKRTGDIYILTKPNWMGGSDIKGTTHGSIYNDDTHVPLIWYGWNINKGSSAEKIEISDISATIAYLLNIQEPNGCIGKPIISLTK